MVAGIIVSHLSITPERSNQAPHIKHHTRFTQFSLMSQELVDCDREVDMGCRWVVSLVPVIVFGLLVLSLGQGRRGSCRPVTCHRALLVSCGTTCSARREWPGGLGVAGSHAAWIVWKRRWAQCMSMRVKQMYVCWLRFSFERSWVWDAALPPLCHLALECLWPSSASDKGGWVGDIKSSVGLLARMLHDCCLVWKWQWVHCVHVLGFF